MFRKSRNSGNGSLLVYLSSETHVNIHRNLFVLQINIGLRFIRLCNYTHVIVNDHVLSYNDYTVNDLQLFVKMYLDFYSHR